MSNIKISRAARGFYHVAISLACEKGHSFLTPEHMMLSLTDSTEVKATIESFGIDVEKLKDTLIRWLKLCESNVQELSTSAPTHDAEFLELMKRALILSKEKVSVEPADIFMAMFNGTPSRFSLYMISHGVDFAKVQNYFLQESCMQGGDAS